MLASVTLLASCATPVPLEPGPHLTRVEATDLPPPWGPGSEERAREYRVGPFDQLAISVFGLPELTQSVQVDAAGRISLPLIGAMEVAGHSAQEVSEAIAAGLRGRYVRNPQVSVNIESTVGHVVTIDGQVREPGLYPVVGRMTLMRAIATAKGTSEFARLEDVVIFRTVEGREMAALYNLAAIRRGLYVDPEVFANDVIIVGDSPSRRMFRDILQASPLVITPIVALLQRI
jgi:polysaccharide export outer membrane protein